MNKKSVIALSTVISSAILLCAIAHTNHNLTDTLSSKSDFNTIVNQGVPADALAAALKAQQSAIKKGEVKDPNILTIVEFNKPSTEKRMKVIDLKNKKVLFSELVAQGSGSGSGNIPTKFSDKTDSHSSVYGAMVTTNIYTGKHGESLRLKGLEPSNKNVASRAVVVHAADYATEDFAKTHGYLGHSWGCFAIDPSISKQIIETIQGGSVLFAYAPQAEKNAA